MEEFQVLRDRALQKIKIADHMLYMTYPVVKDPKLLPKILENVFASLEAGMGSLLWHERLFKNIPPFNDTFPSKLEMFRSRMVPKYKFNPKYLTMMTDIKSLLSEHRSSPVTFARKDKFVICSPSYNIKTIDVNLIKKYIFEAKIFINNVNRIVSANERIFVRSQG
jgi:hypothetical protein